MRTWFKSLDRVLKGESTRPAALRGGTIDLPLGGLTAVLLLLGILYGACMGAFALVARWDTPTRAVGYWQMAASAGKVPMLFCLTLLVTFPSLYVFNALVGSRLSFGAVLRLLVAAMAVTLAVLASFGTIVVFFSLCTTSYAFMVLLNVAMFAIAGVLGMGFLLQTLSRLSAVQASAAAEEDRTAAAARLTQAAGVLAAELNIAPGAYSLPPPVPAPPYAPAPYAPAPYGAAPPPPGALDRLNDQALTRHVKIVFTIWVLVFGLVGSQMGWVLRPFIGSPNAPFSFFREREGNFFEAVTGKLEDLFNESGKPKPKRTRGWGGSSDTQPRRGDSSYGTPAKPTPATRPTTTDE